MDEMTSTEFRKRYAALDEPVDVTVLGRTIGRWTPANWRGGRVTGYVGLPLNASPQEVESVRERFNSRPFAPVPKGK